MNQDTIKSFFNLLNENDEFEKKILLCKSNDEVLKIAQEKGLLITVEEIDEIRNILRSILEFQNQDELTDSELDLVSGGANLEFNYVNGSGRKTGIIIFQKKVTPEFNNIPIAWKVIKNCGKGAHTQFQFPIEFNVPANWNNGTNKLKKFTSGDNPLVPFLYYV